MLVWLLQGDLHMFPLWFSQPPLEDHCCVMIWGWVQKVLSGARLKLCSQEMVTLELKLGSSKFALPILSHYLLGSSFLLVYLAYKYSLSTKWVPSTGLSVRDTDLSRPRTFHLWLPLNTPGPLLLSSWKYVCLQYFETWIFVRCVTSVFFFFL